MTTTKIILKSDVLNTFYNYDNTLPSTKDTSTVVAYTGLTTLGRVELVNLKGGVCPAKLEIYLGLGSFCYILDGYSEFKTFKGLTDYLGDYVLKIGAFSSI